MGVEQICSLKKEKLQFWTEAFSFLAGAGLAFRSQTSCLLPTGRFRSLTHTSCVLFLPLGRRSLHFKSCQICLKQKNSSQVTEVFYLAGAGLEPAASGL